MSDNVIKGLVKDMITRGREEIETINDSKILMEVKVKINCLSATICYVASSAGCTNACMRKAGGPGVVAYMSPYKGWYKGKN